MLELVVDRGVDAPLVCPQCRRKLTGCQVRLSLDIQANGCGQFVSRAKWPALHDLQVGRLGSRSGRLEIRWQRH